MTSILKFYQETTEKVCTLKVSTFSLIPPSLPPLLHAWLGFWSSSSFPIKSIFIARSFLKIMSIRTISLCGEIAFCWHLRPSTGFKINIFYPSVKMPHAMKICSDIYVRHKTFRMDLPNPKLFFQKNRLFNKIISKNQVNRGIFHWEKMFCFLKVSTRFYKRSAKLSVNCHERWRK